MTKSILFLAIASTLGTAAYAEDPAPSPFTANISLTTNYKYRGQDQGSLTPTKTLRPAVQGGFDWTLNGFYVGNWNSSIGWLKDVQKGSSVEMDFYGGYRGEIIKDVGYDVGVLRYQYVGAAAANTTELYGSVSYGPASLKYSHTVSEDYFGTAGAAFGSGLKGRGTGYLDLSGNFEVAKGITLNAHMGFTRLSGELKDVGYENYADYKFGATMDLGSGFSGGAAIVGATKKDFYGDINKARAILTITKSM